MVKRHKSFSAGERPKVNKRLPVSNTLPVIEPAIQQDALSVAPPLKKSINLKRRGTFHTLDIAKKEGIMSRRPGTKVTTVDGKNLPFFTVHFSEYQTNY